MKPVVSDVPGPGEYAAPGYLANSTGKS